MSTDCVDIGSLPSTDNVDAGALNIEHLELRHKAERKTLQANIMQMKKSVPKGDKKRLKEMQQRVIQMEADFERKCNDELNEFNTRNITTNEAKTAEFCGNCNAENDGDRMERSDDPGPRKVSKAEKRREKKRLMDLERDRRIEEDEKQSKSRPGAIENELLNEKLAQKRLRVHEIAADGNCLFNAIVHQLRSRYGITVSVTEVRRNCADHLRQHREEFEPFLDDSEDYDKYCTQIERDCSLWGGNLELRALSQEMGVRITVHQADGPCIEFGDDNDDAKRHLHLSYHRKLISTGAHYNSAIDIIDTECDGDVVSEAPQQ